jgi:hypothetical protein
MTRSGSARAARVIASAPDPVVTTSNPRRITHGITEPVIAPVRGVLQPVRVPVGAWCPHASEEPVMAQTVLVVEDEVKIRELLRSYLERARPGRGLHRRSPATARRPVDDDAAYQDELEQDESESEQTCDHRSFLPLVTESAPRRKERAVSSSNVR